jgi:hypothetical protein
LKDDRLLEMVDIIRERSEKGRFKPGSVWMAWKSWDFGSRKENSRWITFLVMRILKRMVH